MGLNVVAKRRESHTQKRRVGHPALQGPVFRLRYGVGVIQKKDYDFFEIFFADVNCAVNAIAGLGPIDFTHGNLPGQSLAAIAKFDFEEIAAQDHGHAVKGVAVPGCGFARRQALPPDQAVSAMVQHLLILGQIHTKSLGAKPWHRIIRDGTASRRSFLSVYKPCAKN